MALKDDALAWQQDDDAMIIMDLLHTAAFSPCASTYRTIRSAICAAGILLVSCNMMLQGSGKHWTRCLGQACSGPWQAAKTWHSCWPRLDSMLYSAALLPQVTACCAAPCSRLGPTGTALHWHTHANTSPAHQQDCPSPHFADQCI